MQNDLDTLARTIYGEAEANNVDDARAIACVIMNRTKFPIWPSTVAGVCLQPWQFSCWNANDPNRARIMAATGAWFEQCKDIAANEISGVLSDPTHGATHYYASYVKQPKWADGKIPCYEVAHRRGGSHLFFNDIDTKPPETAKEALDQLHPLEESTTMQAAKIGAAGVTGFGVFPELLNQAAPALPIIQTMAQYAPWAIAAVAVAVVAYLVWKRWDDRRHGKQ